MDDELGVSACLEPSNLSERWQEEEGDLRGETAQFEAENTGCRNSKKNKGCGNREERYQKRKSIKRTMIT